MKIFLFQEKLPSLGSTLRITCLTSIILAQTMADFFAPQPSVIERKVTPERKHERMAEAQGGEA